MKNEFIKEENASAVFGAMQEAGFFSLLDDLASSDQWLDCPACEIRMYPSEDEPETIEVELGSIGRFKMFPQAESSLRRRAGEGEALDRMSADKYCANMNNAWEVAEGNCRVLIRAGRILVAHSGRYVPFQPKRLFETFRSILDEEYDKVTFEGSFFTHDRTSAVYEVGSPRLLAAYRSALTASGITASRDVRAFVEMSTSDTGHSSMTLQPALSLNHGENIFISKPVQVNHRDDKTFESCEGELKKIFAAVKDGVANMTRLLGVELTYPSSVAIKLVKNKKWNLPGGLIRELHDEFRLPELMGMTMTAHHFYFTLCELYEREGFKALTPTRQLRVKETLAKIALMSKSEWEKLDVNDVCW